jgi:Ca2+/Na+ antiporter
LGKSLFLFAMLSCVYLFSSNNYIGLPEGICLLTFFVLFIFCNVTHSRPACQPCLIPSGVPAAAAPFSAPAVPLSAPIVSLPAATAPLPAAKNSLPDCAACLPAPFRPKAVICSIIALFLFGQILLLFGAWLLVSFGERIAHSVGLAESTVAIIFIAIGTGLPELFTALASIQKKHNGIALGNILGSCILNCTLLLGSSAVISGFKGGLPISNGILYLSLPVMIIAAMLAVVPIILTQKTKRRYGILLIAVYAAYLFFLFY